MTRPVVALLLAGWMALLVPSSAVAAEHAGPDLKPYLDSRDNGAYVDWLEGRVCVIGRTLIFRDIKRSLAYYEQTKLSAERDGQAKILALLSDLPLDGSGRLGQDTELLAGLEEGMKKPKREPVNILRESGRVFQVDLKYALWGEGSVLAHVLERLKPPAPDPAATSAASIEGAAPAPSLDVTGLVVDARAVDRPAPALLTRIVDENGRLVFGLERVDRSHALERGLAAYVVPVVGADGQLAGARQGVRPMRVRALSASGATRGDLVVSAADADQILKAAGTSPFLKECRVVVLMPPPPALRPRPVQRPAINVPAPADPPDDPNEP